MEFRSFITWTAVGGVLWTWGVTVLGFFLGNVGFIKNNIDAVLVVIVGVSVLPMVFEAWRARRHRPVAADEAADA